ncbi:MAG TPA: GNAT family N-acetyltransferase [bacterium]|nr:GNAT family N-acetyltransferase [bacterium]
MISIRAMVSHDREIVYEMLQKTGVFGMQAINLAMEYIDAYLFNAGQEEYRVVVGEDAQGEVVVFACYGPAAGTEGTCRIYWLVVTPALQHQGIGREMLAWIEERMREAGMRLVVIEVTSEEKHAAFVRFFIEQNYRQVGRIRNYFRAGEDMLFYIKYLQAESAG